MHAIDALNEIANDPDVLKNMAPAYGEVDLTPFFEDSRNVCFIHLSEHGEAPQGALLFGYVADDTYEMHYLCTAALRGKDALQFVKRSLTTMFDDCDALAIVGATPRENRAARAMNRALGATPTGECIDSLGRACICYTLERKAWAIFSAAS